ncbi:energy transducer TonB [Tunturiibacter gelidiferens]|uniref:energy transducer TonB n=1 Tax=Tunturiibacter gelidiferens TaxID=3069689 RepID=UPI003D9BDE20
MATIVVSGSTSMARAAEIQQPVVSRISPNYPAVARRMRVEGPVVVELTAMPDGSVKNVHAVSGHPLLMQAAEDCVSHWRFLPMAKAEHGTVSVIFSLSE